MTVDKELAELRQKYYGLFVHLFWKEPDAKFLLSLLEGITERVEGAAKLSPMMASGWQKIRLYLEQNDPKEVEYEGECRDCRCDLWSCRRRVESKRTRDEINYREDTDSAQRKWPTANPINDKRRRDSACKLTKRAGDVEQEWISDAELRQEERRESRAEDDA